MKSFVTLCLLVLAGFLPATASVHRASSTPHNQFHFQPNSRRATQKAARKANVQQGHHSIRHQQGPASPASPRIKAHSKTATPVRKHTLPTGKIGFLAATQIPAGGGAYYAAVMGDFNGDGVPDIASEVETYNQYNQQYVYAISLVLNNGDGTFQAPVLNTIYDTCAVLGVADLNGDKMDDLVVGHAPDTCGNGNSTPTFEVWLSQGNGHFTTAKNLNFTMSANYVSGGTLADVNADGFIDIILADDSDPANVWTFLGNGDGTFQEATSVALDTQTGNDTTFADLNGDGLLDIVDNDYSTNQITVFLATSATAYATGVPYTTSDSNYNACSYGGRNAPLAVGDINGDGFPEIVNANCSSSGEDVTVYVNNGDGTFADGVYYDGAQSGGTSSGPANVYTESVAIADVNADGFGDILAANDDSGDITVLFGNADGTVDEPTWGYAIGGYPWLPLLVADFNGDGFLDIISPDDEFSFAYLQGYGDGGFRSALNYYAPTTSYAYGYSIATGDFNKDTHTDFVTTNWCSSCTSPMGVTVYLANADGSLQGGINIGPTSDFAHVAVADFDGDGNLDIAATEPNSTLVQLFMGDGTGAFTVGTAYATDLVSNYPYGVVAADFNKDGHPDLAIANWNGADVAILLNDGTGAFPVPVPIALTGNVWQGITVTDLDGDGNLDLVLAFNNSSTNAIGILLGKGDGTFKTETDLDGVPYPELLAIADLNGDAKLDLAATLDEGGGQDIAIALGNGDGTFGTPTLVPSSLQDFNLDSPYPQGIQVADVDGDAKPDLVYLNSEYGTVGVMFGNGDGTFFDPLEYPVGEYNWPLVVLDVNGDGALDAVSSSDDFAGVTVLLNNNGSATTADFGVAPDVTEATVTAGDTGTYNLTITPLKHYNGTITFACASGVPDKTTCTFTPATITLDGLHTGTVTLTLETTAPTTTARAAVNLPRNSHPGSSSMLLATLTGMGLLAMCMAGSLGKKLDRWAVMIALALAMSMFFIACGGSSNTPPPPPPPVTVPGTPAGSYTVTVTGTGTAGTNGAGAPIQSVPLTLTVQ